MQVHGVVLMDVVEGLIVSLIVTFVSVSKLPLATFVWQLRQGACQAQQASHK